VALAITSIALVVFVAALATGVLSVGKTDQLTTAGNLAVSQLETIKAAAFVIGTVSYPTIAAPAGYGVNNVVTTLGPGLQQVTVTVSFKGTSLIAVSNYKVNR
jgi:hypothetical protein